MHEKMKIKRNTVFMIVLIILVLALTAYLFFAAYKFFAFEPRIEIVFSNILPDDDLNKLFFGYEFKTDGYIITLMSDKPLISQELDALLSQHSINGYQIFDSSQIARLAKQAISIYLFCIQTSLLTVIVTVFLKELLSLKAELKKRCENMYLTDVFMQNSEKLIIIVAEWFVLLFGAVFMVIQIIDAKFYIPQNLVPLFETTEFVKLWSSESYKLYLLSACAAVFFMLMSVFAVKVMLPIRIKSLKLK